MDTPQSSLDTRAAALRHSGQRMARYVIVCLIVVVGVDALVGDRGLVDRVKANQDARTLEAALTRARRQNALMRERAKRLRDDPTAVEDMARRELGFLEPGEQLFILKDVTPADFNGRK